MKLTSKYVFTTPALFITGVSIPRKFSPGWCPALVAMLQYHTTIGASATAGEGGGAHEPHACYNRGVEPRSYNHAVENVHTGSTHKGQLIAHM